MKTESKGKNSFTILSGISKPVGLDERKEAISFANPTSETGYLHGMIVRYKENKIPGSLYSLEDCLIEIECDSFKTEKVISGDLQVSVAGAPKGSPAFHMFPFSGKKPPVFSDHPVKVYLTAKGRAIQAGDISVSLLFEEGESEENSKKNSFSIMGGVISSTVASGKTNEQAIVIKNPTNKFGRIHGMVVRYKESFVPGSEFTLEDCLINVTSDSFKDDPIIKGSLELAVAGSPKGSPAFNMFPFAGKKPILSNQHSLKVSLTARSRAIQPGEVAVGFLFEEIK